MAVCCRAVWPLHALLLLEGKADRVISSAACSVCGVCGSPALPPPASETETRKNLAGGRATRFAPSQIHGLTDSQRTVYGALADGHTPSSTFGMLAGGRRERGRAPRQVNLRGLRFRAQRGHLAAPAASMGRSDNHMQQHAGAAVLQTSAHARRRAAAGAGAAKQRGATAAAKQRLAGPPGALSSRHCRPSAFAASLGAVLGWRLGGILAPHPFALALAAAAAAAGRHSCRPPAPPSRPPRPSNPAVRQVLRCGAHRAEAVGRGGGGRRRQRSGRTAAVATGTED